MSLNCQFIQIKYCLYQTLRFLPAKSSDGKLTMSLKIMAERQIFLYNRCHNPNMKQSSDTANKSSR